MIFSRTQKASLFFMLFVLFFLSSCKQNKKASFERTNLMESPAKNKQSAQKPINLERKLIKEGSVGFETASLHSTRTQIFKAVKKYDGYVSSDQSSKTTGKKSNAISIRVPAKNFDVFLNEVTKHIDKFDYKDIRTKDVTDEFVDVQARVKTKKALEKRYLKLLEKAKTVKEILAVENQLGKLRADIESVEGRLKYLKNKITFSTLTLEFYVKTPVDTAFSGKFSRGFKNGWNNLVWFFVFLVNLWPFLVIALFVIFGIKYWRKRKVK